MNIRMGDSKIDGEPHGTPIINVKVQVSRIGKQIFEVPSDIVDVDDRVTDCTGDHCKLSEYV